MDAGGCKVQLMQSGVQVDNFIITTNDGRYNFDKAAPGCCNVVVAKAVNGNEQMVTIGVDNSFIIPEHIITAADYPQLTAEEWSRDFVSFCSDGEEFARESIGIIALNEADEPVAGASSYCRSSKGIEIQVETRPDYRRRGLATVCSAQLMLECITRGLFPNWDAANDTSARIAQKLGYELKGKYEVYKLL